MEARQKNRLQLKPQDGKGQWETVPAAPRRQQCLWVESGLACSWGLSCLKQLIPVHFTFKAVVSKEPFLPSAVRAGFLGPRSFRKTLPTAIKQPSPRTGSGLFLRAVTQEPKGHVCSLLYSWYPALSPAHRNTGQLGLAVLECHPELGQLRQEDQKFKASLDGLVKPLSN